MIASLLLFEGRHIDGEAIFDVRFEQPVVGLVHFLNRNDLDIGGDVVLPAKIQHLLCFGNATNGGTGNAAASEDQSHSSDAQGFGRRAHECESAVEIEQVDVGTDVVIGRNSIQDEVER